MHKNSCQLIAMTYKHMMTLTSRIWSRASMKCFLLIVIMIAVINVKVAQTGCANAGMCCEGMNSTCFVFKKNGMWYSKKCYCDSVCLYKNDCCTDYKTHCTSRIIVLLYVEICGSVYYNYCTFVLRRRAAWIIYTS